MASGELIPILALGFSVGLFYTHRRDQKHHIRR